MSIFEQYLFPALMQNDLQANSVNDLPPYDFANGHAVSASHRALMKAVDRVFTSEGRNICMAGMIPSKFEHIQEKSYE